MLYIIKLFFEMVFMTTTVSPYFYTGYGITKSVPLGDESYDDVNSDNYPELFENLFDFVLVGDNGSDDSDNPSEYPENCEDHDVFDPGGDDDIDSSVNSGENPENCEGHGDFIQGDNYGSDDNANHCEEPENCEDHDGFYQGIGESEDFTLVESLKEVAKQQEDEEPYELIRKHSLCCPMESAVARNLRGSPEVLRQIVNM